MNESFTSSILNTVCYRKPEIAVKSFIASKMVSKPINSPAIRHRRDNEDAAILC